MNLPGGPHSPMNMQQMVRQNTMQGNQLLRQNTLMMQQQMGGGHMMGQNGMMQQFPFFMNPQLAGQGFHRGQENPFMGMNAPHNQFMAQNQLGQPHNFQP